MTRKLTALLLALLLAVPAVCRAEAGSEFRTLKEGVTPVNAIVMVAAIGQNYGLEADTSSAAVDAKTAVMSIRMGPFLVSAHNAGDGTADCVTLSASYLDADSAYQMGVVFGGMCNLLGGMSNANEVFASIDFNAFNRLEASTQTLVMDGVRLTAKVAPDDAQPYQLSLSLPSWSANPSQTENRTGEAGQILHLMSANTSAVFEYDADTDPNHKLGTPGNYVAKVNFGLLSIAPDARSEASLSVTSGGSIEVFANQADALEREHDILSKEIGMLGMYEYTLICGNALLRLSTDVPPAEAGVLFGSFIHAVTVGESVRPQAAEAPAQAEAAPSVAVGDTVTFGSYRQDSGSQDAQPIEWLVLEVNGGEALLVSKYALDVYNVYWGSPTWDNSTLRTWMNGSFYDTAFSAAEKEAVVLSKVPADKNPNYASDPGRDTEDKVFALSYPEADRLLTRTQRRTQATDYARRTRGVYTESGDLCYWWLRSPGKPGCGAAIVGTDGSYDYDAAYDGFSYGVRPAIRVNVAAAGLKAE